MLACPQHSILPARRSSSSLRSRTWKWTSTGALPATATEAATRFPRPRTRPQFHLRTQDELHRTSGWSQLGVSRQNSQSTQFTIYASRCAKVNNRAKLPWALEAMVDLRLAAWLHGYRPLARPCQPAPGSYRRVVSGHAPAVRQRLCTARGVSEQNAGGGRPGYYHRWSSSTATDVA